MSDEDRINSFNLGRATEQLNSELTIISKDPFPGIDLVARTMFSSVKYPGAQPFSRGVIPPLQNVYKDFTISPRYSTPKDLETNSQIPENIDLEEIPREILDKYRNLPSFPKEIIHQVITVNPSSTKHLQRMSDEDRINSYNLRHATKRLNRELNIIAKDPISGIDLRASKDNILEWHFVIHGKEDTPYYGGMYHGKLIFPSNYPFDPPSIIFLTPNGRFMTNERICFSISDFHPEQWKSSYSVVDLLYGAREFMHENTETLGSIETSESEKKQLAQSSSIHNGEDTIFCQLFSKLCGRKVTDSEDSSSESSPSKNTISTVREKTPPPDEISLLPRNQSLTFTEIPLPPKDLAPVLTTPPTHITPSVTRPTFYPVRYPRAQSSSRGVRPRLQNLYQGFTISPIYCAPKNRGTNSQISPNIGLEAIPSNIPKGNRGLRFLPIKRSLGAKDSQRNPPSLPKEIIPQVKTDYPVLIAHPLEKSDEDRINSYNQRRGTKRLSRELTTITKDPIPGIDLSINEDNILEWHFVIHGKEDTPYYGGMYHGKLIFPSNFPFGPPKIIFLTPNGRFKTNERISFSLSDFHPEGWKPKYSVTTVLQGVTDFMHDTTETIGSIETSERVKRLLAEKSSIHNGKDSKKSKTFRR